MNLGQLMDTLRSAYEQLEHPQMSGLKTIHQKGATDSALKAEFDAALGRVDREGHNLPYMPRPKRDPRSKAA